MKKIFKKSSLILLMLIVGFTCLFTGCKENRSEKLWNKYVDAVNSQNIEEVGKTFYSTLSGSYNTFIESNYFENLKSIKTNSFKVNRTIDLSPNKKSLSIIYNITVNASVNGNDKELQLYLYTDSNGTYFCSEFNPSLDNGNIPNDFYNDKYYDITDTYQYKAKVNNKTLNTEITYIEETANEESVVIPAEINGIPVKTIGQYAFYKYNKIICFTVPSSKLRDVVIPEGIETICKGAFYQCKKLSEVSIPESCKLIEANAFTNCSNINKIVLNTKTYDEVDETIIPSSPASNMQDPSKAVTITNAHNALLGDVLQLKFGNTEEVVKWSINAGEATINQTTGELTCTKAGDITIKCELVNDPTNYSMVKINVKDVATTLEIDATAFYRLNGLNEIYIYAKNPNTIKFINDKVYLNSNVKIYIPKGSLAAYKADSFFGTFKDSLIEMQ